MYKCNKCGATIQNTYAMPMETFYGVSNDFNYNSGQYIDLCPYCESADLIEQDSEEIYEEWEFDRSE